MGRRKNEAQRKRILKFAHHLMLENGYEKVSIRKIASEAGIAPSLIQHYFPQKEIILRDIVYNLVSSCFIFIHRRYNVESDLLYGLFYRLFYAVLEHEARLMNIYSSVLQKADILCQGTKYTIESGGEKIADNIGLFVLNGIMSQLIMLRQHGDLSISMRDTVNTALHTYYKFNNYSDDDIDTFFSVIDQTITDEVIKEFIDIFEVQMEL